MRRTSWTPSSDSLIAQQLEIGAVTESVQVTATTPLFDSTASTAGQVIGASRRV
jgi:hypothetical protein